MAQFFKIRQKGGGSRLVVKPRGRTLSHHLYDRGRGVLRSDLPKVPEGKDMWKNRETGEIVRLLEQTQQGSVIFEPVKGGEQDELLSHQFFIQYEEFAEETAKAHKAAKE